MITVWFTHARTGNEKGFIVSDRSAGGVRDEIMDCLHGKEALKLLRGDAGIIVPFELLQQCFITVDEDEE